MYIEETKHFLQCVEGNTSPMQDINSARKVLEIALAAKRASQEGTVISVEAL